MRKDNLTDVVQHLPKTPVSTGTLPQQVTSGDGRVVTLGIEKR